MAGKVKMLVLTGIVVGLLGTGVQAWWFLKEVRVPLPSTEENTVATINVNDNKNDQLIDVTAADDETIQKNDNGDENLTLPVQDKPTAAPREVANRSAAKPVPEKSSESYKDTPKAEPLNNERQTTPEIRPVQERSAESNIDTPKAESANIESQTTPEVKTEPIVTQVTEHSLSYTTHTVINRDTFWSISLQYGIPVAEILKANQMTERTPLTIGMTLQVPVHQIPVKATPSPDFGELVDWWTEAQYLWPINKDAKITDFATKKSFMARRTIGAFHADVEPLTAEDSRIMQEIWGSFSWGTRPVIVEVDGRRLAASSHAMPHSIQTIYNNEFNGHFCVHFLNSTRHKDNLQQADHQRNVRTAAGE